MEFWNPEDLKKYGKAEASPSAVYCEWSPDSLHVMTAILSPRMRVDNSFHYWDYQGNLLYKEDFGELFDIAFRPIPAKLFPTPPLKVAPKASPSSAAPSAAKPAAYRHPNYRGGESSVQAVQAEEAKPKKYQAPGHQPVGIPGDTGPPANKKNKPRRRKKAENGEDA
jgi:translation initiation factor 2A